MKTLSFSISLFVNLMFVAIIILLVLGKITFGHGLGDVFYLFYLLLLMLINAIMVVLIRKKPEYINVITAINIIVFIYYILKLSILRGVENSWNGSFFV